MCRQVLLDPWLCNLLELHVFGGIQYSFLLQEALNIFKHDMIANRCRST